jgi:hypothetical protein
VANRVVAVAGRAVFYRLFTEADPLRLNDFNQNAFNAPQVGDGKAARAAIEQDLNYFGQFHCSVWSSHRQETS